MQGFLYGTQFGRAVVVAETNKHLCWAEVLTVALSLGSTNPKICVQSLMCFSFFPMDLGNFLYSAECFTMVKKLLMYSALGLFFLLKAIEDCCIISFNAMLQLWYEKWWIIPPYLLFIRVIYDFCRIWCYTQQRYSAPFIFTFFPPCVLGKILQCAFFFLVFF